MWNSSHVYMYICISTIMILLPQVVLSSLTSLWTYALLHHRDNVIQYNGLHYMVLEMKDINPLLWDMRAREKRVVVDGPL